MRYALALIALLAAPATAQDDPRLRHVAYVAGAVVTVPVVPGYVASVVLSPDESVESIAVGNSGAWEVTPSKSGNHLFVKPLTTGVATNVEVVTDARSYSFVLRTTFEGDPQAAFRMVFDYPAPPPPSPPVAVTDRGAVAVRLALTPYRIRGNRRAQPLSVVDDGIQTRFAFDSKGAMPAIYAVDGEGHEILVTARRDRDEWVIDRVWPRYILRVGSATANARRLTRDDRP